MEMEKGERKEGEGEEGDINKRGKYVIFSSWCVYRGYYTLRRDTFNRCVCSRFVISMDDLYLKKVCLSMLIIALHIMLSIVRKYGKIFSSFFSTSRSSGKRNRGYIIRFDVAFDPLDDRIDESILFQLGQSRKILKKCRGQERKLGSIGGPWSERDFAPLIGKRRHRSRTWFVSNRSRASYFLSVKEIEEKS